MNMHHIKKTVLIITVFAITTNLALAQDVPVSEATVKVPGKHYSPYVGRNIPDRVLWGDTHLHTSLSPDAGLTGTTLGPDEAFRFARGEVVTSTGGLEVQLRRPHDFLVVSDHAAYLGIATMIRDGDPALLADPTGKRWYDQFRKGGQDAIDAALEVVADIGNRNARIDQSNPIFSSSARKRGSSCRR